MNPVEVVENVYWVGAVDWNLRDFHGYETRRGTTYNAYLIVDEKKALVDTVKHPFRGMLVDRIRKVTSLEDINYIIINHIEKDHSRSLPYIMQQAQKATIVTTERGKEGLTKYYGEHGWNFLTVKTGDELNLGNKTLKFVEAPMLHWPDSMFTYLQEDSVLMPNDAFGQHLASSQRFDDEIDWDVLMDEAAKYYANILMPMASLIVRKIEELRDLGLKPKIIAPSHGIIWRSSPEKIVSLYLEWSKGEVEKAAVIVYDTMWGSTEKMAYEIAEAIGRSGVKVKLFRLHVSDKAEIMKEILNAKAVIIGSPTINNSMFLTVSAFLTYVIGLRPREKVWATFGSYGWGGGAVRKINKLLEEARFEVIEPSVQAQYAPTEDDLQRCRELGGKIAEMIKSK